MAEFEAAIDRLDAELAGSYLLRVIGPLPPIPGQFVARFDGERLAAGRALLGLAGEISEQAVLSRYRELAGQRRPMTRNMPEVTPGSDSPHSMPRALTCCAYARCRAGQILQAARR